MKSLFTNLAVTLVLTISIFQLSFSQEKALQDYLFPAKGTASLSAYSGIPYVGIVDIAYGFSDRFSAGLLIGTTPMVPGIGIRVRYLILDTEKSFRIQMKMPLLYYPQTKGLGGEPWLLTYPTFNAEWTLDSGVNLHVGLGVVAAACYNSLFKIDHHDKEHSHHDMAEHQDEEGFMGGIWNTVQIGTAIPIGKRFSFQAEFGVVLSGVKIAGDDWVGGPPVILSFGMTYGL